FKTERAQQLVERGQEEVVIFEKGEHTQIDANGEPDDEFAHTCAPEASEREPRQIIDKRCCEQKTRETPVPPAIEEIARPDEKPFAQGRNAAQRPADREHDQKESAELQCRE